VLLMRKQRLGIILAPISLVFVIILAIALVGMVMMLKIKGVSDDTSIAGIFIILALLSIVQLLVFLKNLEMPIKN
jgi:predicted membrane channel-forming protein YqfA (hemolysin III family)